MQKKAIILLKNLPVSAFFVPLQADLVFAVLISPCSNDYFANGEH